MPPSMEFLRGVLGLIGVGCALMLGRTVAAVRKGQLKPTRTYAWVIRAGLCLAAITIRHEIDIAAIAIWSLAALAFGFAWWDGMRQKKQEDLTHEIFPEEK